MLDDTIKNFDAGKGIGIVLHPILVEEADTVSLVPAGLKLM
jgi:hypothetical protein